MSLKELDKYAILKRLLKKEINGTQAAKFLKLSIRQTKRLKAIVKQKGPQGLIHRNRGKEGHNKIPRDEQKEIVRLLHKHYYDFKPTFASEKLQENHHIVRDPKTIRRIMIEEKLWKPRTKKQKLEYRSWRQRRSSYGEMIQFDGSYEHWFEERGEPCCLLAAIDDATGKITSAQFTSHEGVFPVFDFWLSYATVHGKPRSVYLDKFSTYHQNHKIAKESPDTLTQFQRAMEELRIEVITANSPQAKGRVERLFGTLQDRLVKELRLRKIFSREKANEFLKKIYVPEFNKKFSVEPLSETNLHEPLSPIERKQLSSIFSRRAERTVQNDFTFSFKNRWYQLTRDQTATVCKKDKIIIEERLDNSLYVRLNNKYLNYQVLSQRQKEVQQKTSTVWVLPAKGKKIPYQPVANHPWRRYPIQTKQKEYIVLTNNKV